MNLEGYNEGNITAHYGIEGVPLCNKLFNDLSFYDCKISFSPDSHTITITGLALAKLSQIKIFADYDKYSVSAWKIKYERDQDGILFLQLDSIPQEGDVEIRKKPFKPNFPIKN